MMNEEESVDKHLLFEQYKIMIESAHIMTQERNNRNAFFTGLLTFITSAAPIISDKISNYNSILYLLLVLEILICLIWYLNIESYNIINRTKFKIITRLEENFPIACFKEENDILQEKRFIKFTTIEKYVPIVLGIISGLIIVLTIVKTNNNLI